jgi:hypothetical protein
LSQVFDEFEEAFPARYADLQTRRVDDGEARGQRHRATRRQTRAHCPLRAGYHTAPSLVPSRWRAGGGLLDALVARLEYLGAGGV